MEEANKSANLDIVKSIIDNLKEDGMEELLRLIIALVEEPNDQGGIPFVSNDITYSCIYLKLIELLKNRVENNIAHPVITNYLRTRQ